MQNPDPRETLRRAAVDWAGGARGQLIVDAAASALASGVDSPTLRVLAGAPAAFADEEATELCPVVFAELGFHIPARLSAEAFVKVARLEAQRYLADGGPPRELAQRLAPLEWSADGSDELCGWHSLANYYDLVDLGYLDASIDIDAQVVDAAERLATGRPPAPWSTVDVAPFASGWSRPSVIRRAGERILRAGRGLLRH